MSPDSPELRLLHALNVAQRFLRMPAAPPREAVATAAKAHGVDVGELALLLLARMVARDRARATLEVQAEAKAERVNVRKRQGLSVADEEVRDAPEA